MLTFITIIHVLLCAFMIFVILLQPGKDAGMGTALGGGAATTAFGGRGAVTFLTKVTAVCAVLFFITSLGLSFVGLKTSVVAGGEEPAPIKAKAPPAAPAPTPKDAKAVQGGAQAPAANAPAEAAPTPAPAANVPAAPVPAVPPKGAAPAGKAAPKKGP